MVADFAGEVKSGRGENRRHGEESSRLDPAIRPGGTSVCCFEAFTGRANLGVLWLKLAGAALDCQHDQAG